MTQNQQSIAELLENSSLQSLVSVEEKQKITGFLQKNDFLPKEPLYIRILIGVGAWFASFFLLIFVGLFLSFSKESGAIFLGFAFMIAAVFIDKASKALFLEQVSLVLAMTGNVLLVVGGVLFFDHFELFGALIIHAIVCCIMYFFFNNMVYRFLAPLALVVIAISCILESKVFVFFHLLVFVEMILVGILVLKKKASVLFAPLTYAAYLMLPATLLFISLTQVEKWFNEFDEPLWPASILLSGGLIYLVVNLAGGFKKMKEPWMILMILGTLILGFLSNPGVLVAIGLLILGYLFDDRILSSLAYLFLISFLVIFYYSLDIDLFQKSLVIGSSGIIFLIFRWLTSRCEPKEELI